MPQGDKHRSGQISAKKVATKVKSVMVLCQKIHVMGNTIYVKSFYEKVHNLAN